jgi:hypothetical protein
MCNTLKSLRATFSGVPGGAVKGIELTGAGKGTELNGCEVVSAGLVSRV